MHEKTPCSFKEKKKRTSGLRAHQQQLGINQVFECFSTLLAKMRIVRGIGALGRVFHLHVFGISVANSSTNEGQLVSTTKTCSVQLVFICS